jgi:membrane-bound metal-dependent hydrolase YbcI (DUF457 family)
MIVFCAIGSVLPDLVSIIFGLLFKQILPSSLLNNARFYSQTLALFLLFLIPGFFIWKYYHSNSFLCVAAGIFLHKIADMWTLPDGYFPLFGPYLSKMYQGYFQNIILEEITSGTEWIFFIVIIGIMFYMITVKSTKDPEMKPSRKKELLKGLIGIILLIFLLFVSIVYILPFTTAI